MKNLYEMKKRSEKARKNTTITKVYDDGYNFMPGSNNELVKKISFEYEKNYSKFSGYIEMVKKDEFVINGEVIFEEEIDVCGFKIVDDGSFTNQGITSLAYRVGDIVKKLIDNNMLDEKDFDKKVI